MTIMVNGVEKELNAIGKNGVEWTNDLLGDYAALKYDEDKEQYTMTEKEFEYWESVVEMLNEINDLEDDLDEGTLIKYEAENFSYCDLGDEARARLDWLKAHIA